jgi:hypothetical protein
MGDTFDLVLVLVDARLDDVEDQADLVLHVLVGLGDLQVLGGVDEVPGAPSSPSSRVCPRIA